MRWGLSLLLSFWLAVAPIPPAHAQDFTGVLAADRLLGSDSGGFTQPLTAGGLITWTGSGGIQVTEADVEAAVDTLANLTSIQGLTVTLADAGANAFFGWDDVAGAYENLTAGEAEAIIEPLIDTLANLTSIQGVSFTFGAYSATLLNNANEAAFKAATNLEANTDYYAPGGTDVAVADGGTGQSTAAEALGEMIQSLTEQATVEEAEDYIVIYDADDDTGKKVLIDNMPGGGGGINNVVEDTSPQLGGNLDLNSFDIIDATRTDTAVITSQEGGFEFINADDPLEIDLNAIDDGAIGVQIFAAHESASPADGDIPFDLKVLAGADDEEVGSIKLELDDGSSGSEDTHWRFFVDAAGADFEAFDILSTQVFTSTGTIGNIANNDGATGAALYLYHNSASPADGDIAGEIQVFAGADDEEVGSIALEVDDGGSGSEDTRWRFTVRDAGADQEVMTLTPEDIFFTADNAMGFFAPNTSFLKTDAGSGPAFNIILENVGDGTDGDFIGQIQGVAYNSADEFLAFTDIWFLESDATDGTEDGQMVFRTKVAGTDTTIITIGDGNLVAPGTDNVTDLGNATVGFRDLFITSDIEFAGDTSNTLNCASGECTIEGDKVKQAGKQTIWIPAGAIHPHGGEPCALANRVQATSNANPTTCNFPNSGNSYGQFEVAFPKNWNEGTITYQFFWTAASGSGAVEMHLGCQAYSNDDALTGGISGSQTDLADTLIATNDLHVSSESGAHTIGGTPAADDLVICFIKRDAADAQDTLSGTVELLGMKIFYTDDDANDD